MEHHAIVKARTGQFLDPFDVGWRPIRLKSHLDPLTIGQIEHPHVVRLKRRIVIDRGIDARRGRHRSIRLRLFGSVAERCRGRIITLLLGERRLRCGQENESGKSGRELGFDHGSIRMCAAV